MTLRGRVDREHPSLVAAMDARGEDVTLAISLADVFAGDIDFSNDLQPGDEFRLVFEKHYSEGHFAGYGPIVAAEFRNDGRVLRAFRFTPDGQKPAYYDEKGRSLARFFLRSPLKFEPRISSGFTMRRLHPVLGIWRAHPAIDYVAPTGSPVVAVASGTVTRAGWTGGGGNTVTIRHSNGYESNYLHLSAYGPGVKAGVRVEQGQLVGKGRLHRPVHGIAPRLPPQEERLLGQPAGRAQEAPARRAHSGCLDVRIRGVPRCGRRAPVGRNGARDRERGRGVCRSPGRGKLNEDSRRPRLGQGGVRYTRRARDRSPAPVGRADAERRDPAYPFFFSKSFMNSTSASTPSSGNAL